MLLGMILPLSNAQANSLESSTSDTVDLCWKSFYKTRAKVTESSTQSVIIQSDSKGLIPYVTLHASNEKGESYNLWQTLNGDVRGYALKEGVGFDYTNTLSQLNPLTWHPTLIWDTLLSSNKPLRNYACVLTGRTRVMGKRVSLLRMIPQEGLRYSYLIAKEDESDFPVELTVIDNHGNVAMRLTVMESRIVVGVDFPIQDAVFEQLRLGKQVDTSLLPKDAVSDLPMATTSLHPSPNKGLTTSNPTLGYTAHQSALLQNATSTDAAAEALKNSFSELTRPTQAATMTGGIPQQHLITDRPLALQAWKELNIPQSFDIIAESKFPEGGADCSYQEFSDGLTSFRVYKNTATPIHFPILSNVTLTVLRKNSSNHEYTVVGELPLSLAEFVLSKISQK